MSNDKLLSEAIINLTRLVQDLDNRVERLETRKQNDTRNAHDAADLEYKRKRDLLERTKR